MRPILAACMLAFVLSGCTSTSDGGTEAETEEVHVDPAPVSLNQTFTHTGSIGAGVGANVPMVRPLWAELMVTAVYEWTVKPGAKLMVVEMTWSATGPQDLTLGVGDPGGAWTYDAEGVFGMPDTARLEFPMPEAGSWMAEGFSNAVVAQASYTLDITVEY